MSRIDRILTRILGPQNMGVLDFIFYPQLGKCWGGAFNGQEFRRRIFKELLNVLSFKAIVETGTYFGATTELFSQTGLPVFSVEAQPRFFGFSKTRFRRQRNVILTCGDSRLFLRSLVDSNRLVEQGAFFYLDAHWYNDLPLLSEVELIFSNWKNAVVMIDDFQVPGENYNYDDYGDGKALRLSYLAPAFSKHSLSAWFPRCSAERETGARRGSVVICGKERLCFLWECSSLSYWESGGGGSLG